VIMGVEEDPIEFCSLLHKDELLLEAGVVLPVEVDVADGDVLGRGEDCPLEVEKETILGGVAAD
jgi:hypothetical protein